MVGSSHSPGGGVNCAVLDALVQEHLDIERLISNATAGASGAAGDNGELTAARIAIALVYEDLCKGRVQEAVLHIAKLDDTLLRDNPRLLFALKKQALVEMLRAGWDAPTAPGTADAGAAAPGTEQPTPAGAAKVGAGAAGAPGGAGASAATGAAGAPAPAAAAAALRMLRSELAPLALDAYPEAYAELKALLPLFVFGPDARGPGPSAALWDHARRAELASAVERTLRLRKSVWASRLALLLRYLLLTQSVYHSARPAAAAAARSDDVMQVGLVLMLQERDAPLHPPDHGAVPHYPEFDVQSVQQAAGVTRPEAVNALRVAGGDVAMALRVQLHAVKLLEPMLLLLAGAYAEARRLLTPEQRADLLPKLAAAEHVLAPALEDEAAVAALLARPPPASAIGDGSPGGDASTPGGGARGAAANGAGSSSDDAGGVSAAGGAGDGSASGQAQGSERRARDALVCAAEEGRWDDAAAATEQLLARRADGDGAGHAALAECASEGSQRAGGVRNGDASAGQECHVDGGDEAGRSRAALRFALRRAQFCALADAGDAAGALALARGEMQRLAEGAGPGCVRELRGLLAALLAPAAAAAPLSRTAALDALRREADACAGAASAAGCSGGGSGGAAQDTLLASLLRGLLAAHGEWFRLQRCRDRFDADLGVSALRAGGPGGGVSSEGGSEDRDAGPAGMDVDDPDDDESDEGDMDSEEGEEEDSEDGLPAVVTEEAIMMVVEFSGMPRATAIELLAMHDNDPGAVLSSLFP